MTILPSISCSKTIRSSPNTTVPMSLFRITYTITFTFLQLYFLLPVNSSSCLNFWSITCSTSFSFLLNFPAFMIGFNNLVCISDTRRLLSETMQHLRVSSPLLDYSRRNVIDLVAIPASWTFPCVSFYSLLFVDI